jgi:hypothetical protein
VNAQEQKAGSARLLSNVISEIHGPMEEVQTCANALISSLTVAITDLMVVDSSAAILVST